MLDIVVEDKRGTILKAAFEVFITYGFRKTSMDDIARAAGVSRPALYQVFKNKTEIFRGLAEEMMRDTAQKAEAAFGRPGSFRDRLYGAVDESILTLHRFVEQTPHGLELIGVSDEITADLDQQWCDRLTDVIARGMTRCQAEGQISLEGYAADIPTAARVFVLALEGLKPAVLRGQPIEPDVSAIVDFMADALTNR